MNILYLLIGFVAGAGLALILLSVFVIFPLFKEIRYYEGIAFQTYQAFIQGVVEGSEE